MVKTTYLPELQAVASNDAGYVLSLVVPILGCVWLFLRHNSQSLNESSNQTVIANTDNHDHPSGSESILVSDTPLDTTNVGTNTTTVDTTNVDTANVGTTGEASVNTPTGPDEEYPGLNYREVMTVNSRDEFDWSESLIARYNDMSLIKKHAFLDELMLRRSTSQELLAFRETHRLLSSNLEAARNPNTAITQKGDYESALALLKDYHMSLIRSMASRGGDFEINCIKHHLLIHHLSDEYWLSGEKGALAPNDYMVDYFIRKLVKAFSERMG
jgi:hypothetical protein